MSGMHLLPVYYSTTNTRKRKKKKKSASVLEAERQHAKFLKKMGIGTRSSVGVEQRSSKPWVTGSSPVECTNDMGGCSSVHGRADASQTSGQEFDSPHLRQDQFYHKSSAKPEPNVYSGERKLIGIATMHKSNSVPIFEDNKELATEIAKMRRG
jgi:hypothetical protein